MRLLGIFASAWHFGLLEFLARKRPLRWWSVFLWLNAPWWAGSPEQRLRLALERLGPIFVKFGQSLSTRPDLTGTSIYQELKYLQDRVPKENVARIKAQIKTSLKEDTEQLFAYFNEVPIGSASVAQVHAAKLKSGEEVIVKVIRPGVEKKIRRDLKVLFSLARLIEILVKDSGHLNPAEVVAEFERTILAELDLQREAANASYLASLWGKSELLYVPKVFWDYTERSVMVQERINGIVISNRQELIDAGISIPELATNGVSIFFTQAFRDGFFHADMHPGNILIGTDGKYKAIDFGIMGTLGLEDKIYLAENLLAFFERDYRKVAEVHLHAGWVPPDTRIDEFEAAVRTVCEPIFARPIGEVSFGLLVLRLLQTAHRFRMPIQPQLMLLQKTMMNIEGVGRQLYPELDLWKTAKPFLVRWLKEQIGVRSTAKELRREILHFKGMVPKISTFVQRSLKQEEERAKQASARARISKKMPFSMIASFALAGCFFIAATQSTAVLSFLEPRWWLALSFAFSAWGLLKYLGYRLSI